MNLLVKAVLYARVSSKEQSDTGFSIPAQLRLLRDYADSHNIIIVHEYIEAESAKQAGRTQFNSMISFLKVQSKRQNSIKTIVVEKTDRLYRNFKDYVIIDEVKPIIHFVKENQILSESSRSSDKLFHAIKLAMAKHYIDNLQEEIKKGMDEKVAQGMYPSYAPIGYLNSRHHKVKIIVPDPKVSLIIQDCFKKYETGYYSLQALTDMVNEKLKEIKSERRIGTTTMSRVLRNIFYTGKFIWKKEIQQGIHAPLTSQITFNRVQQILNSRYKTETQRGVFLKTYQGMIHCSHCGNTLHPDVKKGKYIYYFCRNAVGKKKTCSNTRYLSEKRIDVMVSYILSKLVFTKDELYSIYEDVNNHAVESDQMLEDEQKILRKEKSTLENRLNELIDLRLDNHIEQDIFVKKKYQLLLDISVIDERINSIKVEKHQNKVNPDGLVEFLQSFDFQYDTADIHKKQHFLKKIKSNFFYEDNSIIIELPKPFKYILLSREIKELQISNKNSLFLEHPVWWRWRESNPRPKIAYKANLHV